MTNVGKDGGPNTQVKEAHYVAKETYSYGKRDLFIWQKRPIHMAKETYSYGKRDLFIWQKRPNTQVKEAHYVAKET